MGKGAKVLTRDAESDDVQTEIMIFLSCSQPCNESFRTVFDLRISFCFNMASTMPYAIYREIIIISIITIRYSL